MIETMWSPKAIIHLLDRFQPLANRRDQLSAKQILQVAEEILSQPRCKVLIFGLGNDAPFWLACNPLGRSTFIEDQLAWVRELQPLLPTAEICHVSYSTRIGLWQKDMEFPVGWPPSLCQVPWDVILVDGPHGHQRGTHGRQQSIWSASQVMTANSSVFLHDYERPWERTCANAYLGPPDRISPGKHRLLAQWTKRF